MLINEKMLEYYGVRNEVEIKSLITEIAVKYAWGANFTDLYNALFEIIAVETDFGHAKDTTLESGEGLTQFDKVTFNELYSQAYLEKRLPTEFHGLDYYALRKNPKFAIFMARYFLFKRVPHKIPSTIAERGKDWKKYYNTIYGKGTETHYQKMVAKWEKIR